MAVGVELFETLFLLKLIILVEWFDPPPFVENSTEFINILNETFP